MPGRTHGCSSAPPAAFCCCCCLDRRLPRANSIAAVHLACTTARQLLERPCTMRLAKDHGCARRCSTHVKFINNDARCGTAAYSDEPLCYSKLELTVWAAAQNSGSPCKASMAIRSFDESPANPGAETATDSAATSCSPEGIRAIFAGF